MKRKAYITILKSSISLLLLLPLLSSCSKDNVINTKYLETYLGPDQFQTDATLPTLSFDLYADGRVNGGNKPAVLSFANPIKLSTSSPTDINVKLKFADKSLVDEYNVKNNTKYSILPEGACKLQQESFVIKSGKLIADTDSIRLNLADAGVLTSEATEYLLPIILDGLESKDAGAKINTNAMFIKVIPKVYLASLSGLNMENNVINMVYTTTSEGDIFVPPSDRTIQVKLNPKAGTSTAVEVVSGGEAAVNSYNTANNKSYTLLPASNYSITSGGTAVFEAGQSTIDLSVKLLNNKQLDVKKQYLLPLTLKQGNIAFSDKKANTVMIVISAKVTNIDLSSKTPVAGTVVNRSNPAWSIVEASRPYNSTYAAANVLDNRNTTSWFAAGVNSFITLDMAQSNTVKGFVLMPSYAFGATYNATGIDVFTSNDNVTWTSQGTYTGERVLSSSSATSPDNRNINFYTPVSCRYVKFVMSTLPNSYGGFSEINAIK